MDDLDAIFKFIDKHREAFIEDLRTLLKQPTIAATKEGVKETADMTAGFLKEAGVEADSAQIGDGSPMIYGELEAEDIKKTLLLYSMYDVMPVNPELWTSPPWDARIVDEKIVARGAVNTKGPLMAQIAAVKAIMKVAGRPPVNLIILIEGEEELGSPSLPAFVKTREKNLKKADALTMLVGVPEGEEVFDILLGMKGIIVLDLEVKLREMDIHGCYAPILDNPAWRLCWALCSMKDVRDEIRIDGFYDKVLPIRSDDLKLIEECVKTINEEKMKALCGTERLRRDMHGVELLKELLLHQP